MADTMIHEKVSEKTLQYVEMIKGEKEAEFEQYVEQQQNEPQTQTNI
jgi:hypothetical protein